MAGTLAITSQQAYLRAAGAHLVRMTTRVLRRRTIVAVTSIALLLPLASCGEAAVVGTPQPTPTSRSEKPAEPKPPTKTEPRAKTKPKAPATTQVLATDLFGTQYAYLRSAKSNRLTFDLVEYFKDEQARKACDADHVYASEGVWCVDYYIRNKNPRLRTLGADPAGPYRLLTDDGPAEVSLGKFIAALRGQDRVFKFYVDGGRILRADEVPA
jgi:hypothetical protein